jgi:hypothetical protein
LLLNESANSGSYSFQICKHIGKGTNWQDETLSTGVPIISHDLTFSGGSDKITSVSGSHLDQEGIVGQDKSGFLKYGKSFVKRRC